MREKGLGGIGKSIEKAAVVLSVHAGVLEGSALR